MGIAIARSPQPSAEPSTYPWFALTIKPRHEHAAAASLAGRGYESFLPLYRTTHRWSDRLKTVDLPLFPGYVFCRFDYFHRLPVLTTPGVFSVVSFGGGPHPVDPAELAAIQEIVRSGVPAEPWPFLRAGQRVRVERGPLAGTEGILLQIKGHSRIVVSVSILQRSVAAQVDRDCISPIS